MEIKEYLAKSKANSLNAYLVNHTRMVINFGIEVGKLVYQPKYRNEKFSKKDFLSYLALSLCLHDIGKMTKSMQSYLSKGKTVNEEGVEEIKKGLSHNIYSWAYAIARLNWRVTDKSLMVASSVLYHHSCDVENQNSDNILNGLSEEELSDMDKFYIMMKDYCSSQFKGEIDLSSSDFDINFTSFNSKSINETPLYKYVHCKGYDSIEIDKAFELESEWSLIRAILILSDRLISGGKCELQKIYDNDTDYIDGLYHEMSVIKFVNDVDMYQFDYDHERLSSQYGLLADIEKDSNNVIMACAGWGKTLFGLMWFFKWKKRLLWVVPRNVIATSTFLSIVKELQRMGINDNVKVGVYYGGTIVDSNTLNRYESVDDFDILVTNIDSIVSRTSNNSMAHLLVNMYTSNVIFDEFHEFVVPDPLYSAFIRLMRTRSRYTDSKSLILSATAIDFSNFWGKKLKPIDDKTDILFGDTKINIRVKTFGENEKLSILEKDNDTFIICRTVAQSQKVYLENDFDGKQLIHARFTNKDRRNITDKVFLTHGNTKDKEVINSRQTVIGTNIIGTGLDISCRTMYDFIVSPESTIQRCCGRCSRFGEYGEITYYICDIDSKMLSPVITNQYDARLYKEWKNILCKLDRQSITKREMYDLFKKFKEDHKLELNKFYVDTFNKSSDNLQGIKLKTGSKKNASETKKLSDGLGYRGLSNNVFVTTKRMDDNSWCDSISVDYDLIFNSEDGEGDNTKLVKGFMFGDGYKKENVPQYIKYPNFTDVKYKMGGQRFKVENCKRLAKDETHPLPLFDFSYNSELGLIQKNLCK